MNFSKIFTKGLVALSQLLLVLMIIGCDNADAIDSEKSIDGDLLTTKNLSNYSQLYSIKLTHNDSWSGPKYFGSVKPVRYNNSSNSSNWYSGTEPEDGYEITDVKWARQISSDPARFIADVKLQHRGKRAWIGDPHHRQSHDDFDGLEASGSWTMEDVEVHNVYPGSTSKPLFFWVYYKEKPYPSLPEAKWYSHITSVPYTGNYGSFISLHNSNFQPLQFYVPSTRNVNFNFGYYFDYPTGFSRMDLEFAFELDGVIVNTIRKRRYSTSVSWTKSNVPAGNHELRVLVRSKLVYAYPITVKVCPNQNAYWYGEAPYYSNRLLVQ